MSDKQLWSALKKGDENAFLQIYENVYQELYAYGFRVSGHKELTKDTIHQVFLELWSQREKLNDVSAIKPYLITYLRRKLLKELSVSGAPPVNDFDDYLLETQHSYEDLLIKNQSNRDMKDRLQKALDTLTKKQLEIIKLKFYEGMSYDEIGQVTNLQRRTIYNHLHQAIKILRDAMLLILAFHGTFR